MAARAATTVATRRNLQFLCHRFQASNCFFPGRVRGAEAGKQVGNTNRRIYGALPKNMELKPKFGVPPPPAAGCDPSDITSVSETKCTSPPYRFIDGLQRMSQYSLINGLQRSTADISPKLDIFINYLDEDRRQYFTGHSVEDGHISPAKYHIYPPFHNYFFTGNSCNGLLLFQNGEWENLVWNPTTSEFKIFPKTFDKVLPPGITHDYLDCGMWYDPSYGYKVLQVVMASLEDEEGCYMGASFHIELYSSKSNSWKKIQCAAEFGTLGMRGECINGIFYSTGYRKEEKCRGLLLFDFSTETLSTVPFPPDTRGSARKYYLDYKGLFGYIVCWFADKSRSCKFELWVLKKDRSWMRESVFHTCGVRELLWFSQNGELLYFASYDNELVVFDRAIGKLKHLGIYFYAGDIKQLIPVRESFERLDRILDVEGQEKNEDEDVNATMDGPFEALDGALVQA